MDAEVTTHPPAGTSSRGRLDGALGTARHSDGLAAMRAAKRWPHRALLGRALALRDQLTAYDAIYVAMAEATGATLVTRDARLARATGHRARVEVV